MEETMIVTRLLLSILLASAGVQHQHSAAPQKGMRTPTVTSAPDGRLWRVWIEEGQVFVGMSSDRGKSWKAATRVTRDAETIDANGESRPKIALGPKGEIYVSWTRSGKKPYTGDIRFSRSLDGGKTFDSPRTINDDKLELGHRFDALAVAGDGTIHVAWIDKRDLEKAKAAKRTYEGAALYYSISRDRGSTFSANRKIKDNVCECCRIAHAFDATGNLVLVWRDATGNLRDHTMVRVTPEGKVLAVEQATKDGWKINACPHHGPAVAAGGDGAHLVWFTGTGPQGPGTFYLRLRGAGAPQRLTTTSAAHADVALNGRSVFVTWKEANPRAGTSIVVAVSNDGGATFSPPRKVAETTGMSDHPFLVSSAGSVYVSWFAAKEGHRLIAL